MPDRLTFSFNGEAHIAKAGQTLAAALTDAGERVFRLTSKGAPRGVFCGMGVCQDCLLTVDGIPNQRGCMTLVHEGATVLRQDPRPSLQMPQEGVAPQTPQIPDAVAKLQELSPDVLVVGAGVGGLNAGAVAARAGAKVCILDERKVAGGQYFKQPAAGEALLDRQQSDGAALFADAKASGAVLMSGVEIWGVFPGPRIYATNAEGTPLIFSPQQLIVATGAYERPQMVPGWTLPGVMTTGAAQTLWRSYRSLPGKRVAVCGSGPLNLQVALELAKGGADVRMVAESAPSPLRRPWSSLALAIADPTLALIGMNILAGLRRAKVPVRYNASLLEVEGDNEGTELRASFRVDNGIETLELDAVCMNDGFEPQNEILRLLGAEMYFDPRFGHFRCVRNASLQTSIADVYAVGDCCGLGGAPAAAAEGCIAGAAAAAACGEAAQEGLRKAQRQLKSARRFQKYLWSLYNPEPRALDDLRPETLLCRCEEVSLGQFRAGMAEGATHIGAVKLATRVGMGCCQGRYCGPVAARLLAQSTGQAITDCSHFAPRVPIKPVSIEALLATQEALDAKA